MQVITGLIEALIGIQWRAVAGSEPFCCHSKTFTSARDLKHIFSNTLDQIRQQHKWFRCHKVSQRVINQIFVARGPLKNKKRMSFKKFAQM